ncbi:MAG: Mur ligase family protein [Saprospiraceae bacterium]
MRIHFIAIGGSAMHNLALALHDQGHIITGSDDEIYEPSRTRLDKAGLLPKTYGWYIEKIEPKIDAIILGMHAHIDNPELLRAQKLNIPIYSYPEFVAKQSKNKRRVVIAGSHGKTTTTSIIMHALSFANVDYDYLVGAQLKGFDRMVRLSDSDLIILEGDEYLSSPIDRRPKMMHYNPDIAVITGIAWDHINVFPTLENYENQFQCFVSNMAHDSCLFYYSKDEAMVKIINNEEHNCKTVSYNKVEVDKNKNIVDNNKSYLLNLIGNHNLQNIKAAQLVCNEIGVSNDIFFNSLSTFAGASKRLQILKKSSSGNGNVYLDFAHAPSKVKATTQAVKDWYPDAPLLAVFELHTYSSLNKDFLPQYKNTLAAADIVIIYFSKHALEMKRMPMLNRAYIKKCFDHLNIIVVDNNQEFKNLLASHKKNKNNTLFMTSGTFDGIDLNKEI